MAHNKVITYRFVSPEEWLKIRGNENEIGNLGSL